MATIMANAEDKLLTMGDLYYCTDVVDFTALTALTSTNQDTVRAELEAFNYETVGHIKNFNVTHSLENEEIIRAGNCGVGELARLVEKTPTINFTWLDVNNRPVFDTMLGLDRLAVAGTPVAGATQDVVNPSAYLQFIKIANQNYDGSAITVNSVTGDTDGLLVAGTDYDVVTDDNGVYGIQLISGGNITTLTQTFTIDYDYTPTSYTLDWYNVEKDAVPYGLYKFVSCKSQINSGATDNAVQDTIYFAKYVLNGELVEQYIDRTEEEFAGTETSAQGATGGIYLKQKATVTL